MVDPIIVNPTSRIRQRLIRELAPMGDSKMAFHPGGDPGTVTSAAIDITHGRAALCFANITPAKDKSLFQKEIIRRLLKKAGQTGAR